ncbi:MAG: hypothetical protein KJZ92_14265 [Rhodocyclaceae bacterium]|nr:hypothetical protein [Rhodocyclaceae bacterium]
MDLTAFARRTETTPLDPDPKQAKANLLSVLRGDDPIIAARADLAALTQRNRELMDGGPEVIREALADQLILLETAMLRFMREAAGKGMADNRRALASVALRCQQSFVMTAAALHRLNQEHADSKAIMGGTCGEA